MNIIRLMCSQGREPGGWWESSILKRFVDARRRQILAILLDRSAAVGEQELATRLVAARERKRMNDVSNREAERMRTELHHSHLPMLNDADLIVWNRADATIATTDHPSLQDPRFRYVVDKLDESWDEIIANLVVERRRVTLSVLEAHDGSMSKSTLAREVAIREDAAEPSSDEVQETLIALHHVHLPKLRAARLIEYDEDEGTVSYCGRRELEETWFDVRPDETGRADFQSQTR